MRCAALFISFLFSLIASLPASAQSEEHPTTLPEVLARMDGIAGSLSSDDGIVQFNRLYSATTRIMAAAIEQGRFEDAAFMTDFTVRFADLVLADTFEQLRGELLDGPLWFRLLGDTTALPWVRTLRDKAWLDGKALWELRGHPVPRGLYLEALDLATRGEAASNFLVRI